MLVGPDTRVEDDDLDFVPLRDVRSERFALPFDHAQLVQQACERLASKSVYSALPLFLLAPRFTVAEALKAFECAIGQEVQHSSLRGAGADEGGWLGRGHRRTPASAHGAPATRPAFHPVSRAAPSFSTAACWRPDKRVRQGR